MRTDEAATSRPNKAHFARERDQAKRATWKSGKLWLSYYAISMEPTCIDRFEKCRTGLES